MKNNNISRKDRLKSKRQAPANYLIVCEGTGLNTESIVKYTERMVNYSSKVYGQVWVLFDKDVYDDQFNRAIENCNYNVAWSNPNIEL